MAAAKKDKRVSDVQKHLKVVDELQVPAGDPSEQACWVILARHGTKEGATKALEFIRQRYVDLNEFRIAYPLEVSRFISSHVKNDALTVAETLHGFLWRFHKDHHTMDYGRTADMTPTQLAKYFNGAEEFVREMGLAIFLYYCADERLWMDEESLEEKPRKRTEREATAAFDKLALSCAVAVFGSVPAKTKITSALRQFAKTWAFKVLPKVIRKPKKPVAPPPIPVPVIKKPPLKGAAARAAVVKAPASKASKTPVKKAVKKAAVKKVVKKSVVKATPKTAPKTTKKAAKKTPTKKASAKKAPAKKVGKKTAKKKKAKAAGTARPKTTRPNRTRNNKSSRR